MPRSEHILTASGWRIVEWAETEAGEGREGGGDGR